MTWKIEFTNQANKQVKKLNRQAFEALRLLVESLKLKGPAPGKSWPNYGKVRKIKT